MDPFIGEIRMFVGTYAPEGWLFCWGQSLTIQQYQALFAVIGTQYGGDGVHTFNLPDFRGRIAVCAGAGTGLTPRNPGDKGGAERVALDATQMPTHLHPVTSTASTSGLTVGGTGTIKCSGAAGNTANPTGSYLSLAKSGATNYTSTPADATGTMATDAVQLAGTVTGTVTVASQSQSAGGNQSHENMPPWLAVNFIIAINGIFPPRP